MTTLSTKITTKSHWVKSDGWRGYSEPIYWIAGANDTGMYSDSPCPSKVATEELKLIRDVLRKAGIKYRHIVTQSSNVFCVHRYLIVSPADHDRAKELMKAFKESEDYDGTRLLYVNNK